MSFTGLPASSSVSQRATHFVNSGMYFHQACPRMNGVPMQWPKLDPGGNQSVRGLCVYVWNTRCVTPRANAWLIVPFRFLKSSSHLRRIDVQASAATRPFPYTCAADAQGMIGLKSSCPTLDSARGNQNSHMGVSQYFQNAIKSPGNTSPKAVSYCAVMPYVRASSSMRA